MARKYIDYHTKQFGYDTPNVSFVEGYIEDLQACGIGKESTDIIVWANKNWKRRKCIFINSVFRSNCVICLCQDKQKVFRSAYDVLKVIIIVKLLHNGCNIIMWLVKMQNGGELYFSDMYADRMVPARFKNDKILWGATFWYKLPLPLPTLSHMALTSTCPIWHWFPSH